MMKMVIPFSVRGQKRRGASDLRGTQPKARSKKRAKRIQKPETPIQSFGEATILDPRWARLL